MNFFRAEFAKMGFDVDAAERAAVTHVSSFSIHSVESVRFMQQVIGASGKILSLLKGGLQPDIRVQNFPYREDNNVSVNQDLDFVKLKVKEWVAEGAVSKLQAPSNCCSPLSLVLKFDAHTDTVKKRSCLDLSRNVNKRVPDEPVKLDDLSVSEKIVEPMDFMTAFDLKNQFFHVKLHPAACQFFGFAIQSDTGGTEFFQFNVLPYGFKPAVAIVTKLLLPVKAFLHRFGIRLTLYIDDGRILGKTVQETAAKTHLTLLVLQLAGWNVQWSKTVVIPVQSLYHLGFTTDTIAMQYSTPPEKLKVLKDLLLNLVQKGCFGQPVHAKLMAQALGKVISLCRSHGNILRIMSRSAQHALGKQVFRYGWLSSFILDEAVIREFQFIASVLDQYNGQYIFSAITASHVFELSDVSRRISVIQNTEQPLNNLYVSLANDTHTFVYLADGSFSYVQESALEPGLFIGSSHRALAAVLSTLKAELAFLKELAPVKVFWQTDSRNCYLFLSKGSRQPAIQADIVAIKRIEKDCNISVIPVWTPKEHGRLLLADLALRFSTSTDEWCISRPQLWDIFKICDFHPTVDCCASKVNAICAAFFSAIPQTEAAGVNFLAQTLSSDQKYFCCPPVALIVPCFKKLLSTPSVCSLLLIPEWTSAIYWPYIFNGKAYCSQIKVIVPFQPNFFFSNKAVSKVFTHSPNFRMLALKIVT